MAGYTTLNDLNLSAIAEQYGLVEAQAHPLKGGAANSSFKLVCASGEFVLTVLDNHNQISAERLAAHTQALYAAGMPTAEVVLTTEGNRTALIDGRVILLKRWLAGQVLDPLPDLQIRKAGRLLAKLHSLPTDLPDLPVGTRRLSTEQRACITDFQDHKFAEWLTTRLMVVDKQEAQHRRTSVISHGDLFADNTICGDDGSLSIIDWETVSLDDPLLDLGMAAVGLAQENGRLLPRRVQLLVQGYNEVRPLSEQDMGELPNEITHAGLIIAFHRYYRHNVRFPNPRNAELHLAMVDFVESVSIST